jgi:hypothetical protein
VNTRSSYKYFAGDQLRWFNKYFNTFHDVEVTGWTSNTTTNEYFVAHLPDKTTIIVAVEADLNLMPSLQPGIAVIYNGTNKPPQTDGWGDLNWAKYPPLDPTVEYQKSVCECGASKAYGEPEATDAGLHSTWCPLFK